MKALFAAYFEIAMGVGYMVASYLLIKKKVPILKYFCVIAVPLSLYMFYRVVVYVSAYHVFESHKYNDIEYFEVIGEELSYTQDLDKFSEWLKNIEPNYKGSTQPINFSKANVVVFKLKSGDEYFLRVLDKRDGSKLIEMVSGPSLNYTTYGFFVAPKTEWGSQWIAPLKDTSKW